MKKWLFCLALFPLWAESPLDLELPITDVETGLPTIAANCVNVITGDYIEQLADIHLPGPIPLSYERFYSSADYQTRSLFCGWRHNHDSRIKVIGAGSKSCHAFCTDLTGRSSTYKGEKKLNYKFNKRMTNCGSGILSARTNPKNTCLTFNEESIDAEQPSGNVHSFDFYKKEIFEDSPDYNPSLIEEMIDGLTDPRTEVLNYKIAKQSLTNGLKIHYSYDEQHQPRLIRTTDHSGKITFSALRFHQNAIDREHGTYQVSGSNGSSVLYEYHSYNHRTRKEKRKGVEKRYHITKAIPSNGPPIHYKYRDTEKGHEEHIIKRSLPDDRYRRIAYYDSDRVEMVSSPAGTTPERIPTHQFFYHKGYTDVLDARGHTVRYEYDKNYRLFNVLKFFRGEKDRWIVNDRYVWDEESQLLCHHVKDHKATHASRFFEYDPSGNVKAEHLYGVITGRKSGKIELDKHDLPLQTSEVDCYKKEYTYSKGLLESESDGTGFRTEYIYHPETELVKAKLVYAHDKIKIRYFFEYHPTYRTVCKIVKDDGCTKELEDLSGVTERILEVITPRKQAPFGLPEIVEEMFLDLKNNKEVLIKKSVIHYSPQGKVVEKEIYDSQNEKRYTLYWEYDAYGNVTLERDALGRVTQRTYDQNSNLIKETKEGYQKEYEYDFMNRCIAEKILQGQEKLVTTNTYDFLSNRTAVFDLNGNGTKYKYDELGRVIKIVYPDETSEAFAYDLFNGVIRHQDQRGLITKMRNNIFGQPLYVCHPDNSIEMHNYTIKGKLSRSREKNGRKVHYRYDVFGRLLEDENKICRYNSFHLRSETDREGNTTFFDYDGAGRLIAERKKGKRTTYAYDALGNQSEIREWLDDKNYRVHYKEYDLLGQIIKEMTGDDITLYQYDAEGNCISVDRNGAITKTQYDFQKRPTRIEDPLGQVTHIEYHYGVADEYGQHVMQVITTEPSGHQHIITKNVLNHDAKIERRDPFKRLLSQKKLFYNGKGELLKTVEGVYFGDTLEKEITNTWEYSQGHLVRLTEAAGSQEQRITTFAYNKAGEKIAVNQPNGLQLAYRYDAKGRLTQLKSSGIDYTYKYNELNLPIEVTDAHGGTTRRRYDAFGNIAEETLANGYSLAYEYDRLGRLVRFTLPDSSTIHYEYDAFHLLKIGRYTAEGALAYTHTNAQYDPQGRLTHAELPGQAGAITYRFDALSRPLEIAHPLWAQKVTGYDLSGNMTGYNENTFAYDGLNQLISEKDHTYQYDSLLNRRSHNGHCYKYNCLNQIEGYRYDPNGNLVDDGEAEYAYDALNRLTKVTRSGKEYHYTYDAFNRRITKQGDATVHYLYMQDCEIGSSDGDLRILRTMATEIGSSIAFELDGQPYIPLQDIDGHVVALLDLEGHKVETHIYTAFGEESTPAGRSPWGFSGKRKDEESGFLYFGNRFYAPRLGRFLNPDPAGYEDGSNLYAYAKNNPIANIDHFGLSSSSVWQLCSVLFSILFNQFGVKVGMATGTGKIYAAPMTGPVPLFGPPRDLSTTTQHTINIDEDGGMVIFCNGVQNNEYEFEQNLAYLQNLCGGLPLIGIHHHTCGEGLLDDFLRYFIYNLSGNMSTASKELLNTWTGYIASNPGKRILMICHSEGAVHVRNTLRRCPPEVSKQIDVVVIAGGAYIDRELAGSVVHFCSKRDFIPLLDPFGRKTAIEQGTVNMLEPAYDAPLFDHSFRSPTYKASLRYVIDKFSAGL